MAPVWLSPAVAANPEVAKLVAYAKAMRCRGYEGFDVDNETWEYSTLRITLGFNKLGGQVVYEFVKPPDLTFRVLPSCVPGWKRNTHGGFSWF